MLLLRLEHIGPLLDATFILDQCSNNADVRISPAKLSIITSSSSHRFFVRLEMSPESFVDYSVDRNQSLMISIPSFRCALKAGRTCPFVKFHLLQDTRQIILTFESPNYVAVMDRGLEFFPPQRIDVGQVNEARYFSISSQDFRRIVRKDINVPHHGTIDITLTEFQAKFCIGTEEFIFIKERGECEIAGYAEEFVDFFEIIVQPVTFFLELSHQADRVWFFQTTDFRSSVICIPALELDARYFIYFPQW